MIIRAALVALLGIFCFEMMGAFVKMLVADYPVMQLSSFRNLVGIFPALIMLLFTSAWRDNGKVIIIKQWPLAMFRGLAIILAQFCFYYSLAYMELATAATLAYAGPVFVVALSVPILGEKVGIWRWGAVGIGFLGVILVMRPGSDVFTLFALLPLGAAFGYALAGVTLRRIDPTVPIALLVVYAQATAFVGSLILLLLTTGLQPIASWEDFGIMVGLGLCGGFGALLITIAYRMAQPSAIAPFEYFGIPFAFCLGWIFFMEAPFDRLIPGVFLIVAAGLLILWRERFHAQKKEAS